MDYKSAQYLETRFLIDICKDVAKLNSLIIYFNNYLINYFNFYYTTCCNPMHGPHHVNLLVKTKAT